MIKKLSLQNSITLITLVCVSSLPSWAHNTQGELLADGATSVTSQMLARDYNDLQKIKNQSSKLLQQAQYLVAQLPGNALALPLLASQINSLKIIFTAIDQAEKQRSDISTEKYMQIENMLNTIKSDISKVEASILIEQQNKGER